MGKENLTIPPPILKSMNYTSRIQRRLSVRLLLAHAALITLVTVAMVVSLPINNLHS